MNQIQLLESLIAQSFTDNHLPVDFVLVEKVKGTLRKAGKRVFTPALRIELNDFGIQTEPIALSHETVISEVLQSQSMASLSSCANAFIAGLSAEFAALRAPLRAFAVVAHFPSHGDAPAIKRSRASTCRVCGYESGSLSGEFCSIDHHHGLLLAGIHGRVSDLYQAAKTLEWFATLPPISTSIEQTDRFEELLKIIAAAPKNASCNSLTKELSGVLGGDKYNRLYVLETLGYCGVLNTKEGEPLLDRWIDRRDILDHPNPKNDTESPACFWKREFGFNGTRFRQLFPTVRLPAELDIPS